MVPCGLGRTLHFSVSYTRITGERLIVIERRRPALLYDSLVMRHGHRHRLLVVNLIIEKLRRLRFVVRLLDIIDSVMD